jgi:enoyl-CoA hydratase/carnithine racemase
MTAPIAKALAPLLTSDDRDGVATLTLNRVETRNSLSLETIGVLQAALDAIAADRKSRVVILAARGRSFSSGHDLKEIRSHRNDADHGYAYDEELFARCATMMKSILALPQPVIAAVEGAAVAAGCQLVATCDLAIAGDKAEFGLPGVKAGLFCSTPLVAVGRAISRKRALEMAMTGDLYSAHEAERLGLVNRVVPAGTAEQEARELALALINHSGKTLALGKSAFYQQIEMPIADAYDFASRAMVENLAERDADEGISAFLDKRAPRWEEE